MTRSDVDVRPYGDPDVAAGNPGGHAPAEPATRTGRLRKALITTGILFAVGIVALVVGSIVTSAGDPEVGDCVHMKGETDVDVVDCGTSDAQYRIAGIEKDQQCEKDFTNDTNACAQFPAAEVALWIPGYKSVYGTVYCAGPV